MVSPRSQLEVLRSLLIPTRMNITQRFATDDRIIICSTRVERRLLMFCRGKGGDRGELIRNWEVVFYGIAVMKKIEKIVKLISHRYVLILIVVTLWEYVNILHTLVFSLTTILMFFYYYFA